MCRTRVLPTLALLAAAVVAGPARADAATAQAAEPVAIDLATTTSVRDSGLLDALLGPFRERTGARVRVIAVGTGAALRMGAEGNADVLVTHAPEAEEKLVASGAAVSRRPFMENHFAIAGPPEDPARVREASTAAEAFRRLAAAGAPYVSRDDDSGTHKREVALMRAAGLDPEVGWRGVLRTGSGMGLALQVAGERRAYALSDIGTLLAFEGRTGLVALSQPSPDLRNVYSVLRVDPARAGARAGSEAERRRRADAARAFEDYLIDPQTQQRIARYGVERFGRPLFRPLHLPPTRPARGDPAPTGPAPSAAAPPGEARAE